MPKLDVHRSTELHNYLQYKTGKSRRDTRVHTSTETKINLPWNTVIATEPIPEWKAYYIESTPYRRQTPTFAHEVNMQVQMLAWDLPAVLLVSRHTQQPFFQQHLLIPTPQSLFPTGLWDAPRPVAFPTQKEVGGVAGKGTVFTGLEVYPPGHNSTAPWMRSTFTRNRETPGASHHTTLLIDPVGQKSVELRTTHMLKDTDQTIQVVMKGKAPPQKPDSLAFQTVIKIRERSERAIHYLFDAVGDLINISDKDGKSLPVDNMHTFAQHVLRLGKSEGIRVDPTQTLRALWLNAGRKTPYNPLNTVVTPQKVPEPITIPSHL